METKIKNFNLKNNESNGDNEDNESNGGNEDNEGNGGFDHCSFCTVYIQRLVRGCAESECGGFGKILYDKGKGAGKS